MNKMAYIKVLFHVLAFMAFDTYAQDSEDGTYGYYWYVSSSLTGSTSYEAAMAECALYAANNPSCVGVVLQSSSDTQAIYKRSLSNGSQSIATVTVTRTECGSGQQNIDSCQEGYGQVPVCDDGYPQSLTIGTTSFQNCDRPEVKQCDDGSYVRKNSFCPMANCYDHDSCFQYKLSTQPDCTGANTLEFIYISPSNNSLTCEEIDPNSPDNPNNGGNADGNPNNDPNSDPQTGVGNVDVGTLANAIDSALQNDFSNVERATREGATQIEDAVRDGTASANASAEAIKEAISALGIGTGEGFIGVEDAINNAFSSLEGTNDDGFGEVVDAVDVGNSTLSQISDKLDDLAPCEPTPENNNCENPHGLEGSFITSIMEAIQEQFESDKTEAVDTVKGEIEDIQSSSPLTSELSESELTSVWSYFTDIWPAPSNCMPLTFGSGSKPWNITISCEFSDRFKAIFGFLISIYTIMQLVDILFSGIKPKTATDR